MKKIILSIIIPCYNEEEVLPTTKKRLLFILNDLEKKNIISNTSFLLFIDDGSNDKTWTIIEESAKNNSKIKGLKFSKNFGHQNALIAGMMFSKDKADAVLSIDADLQQDEKAIYKFLEKYNKGYEIINGVRTNRQTDSLLKKITATGFYRLMKIMGVSIIPNSADFRLVSSRVITELEHFHEANLFLRGLFPGLGFKTTTVSHIVKKRFAGKAKYSFKKMLILAIDGITSFSIVPIRFVTILGFLVSFVSLIMTLYIISVFFLRQTVPGWASTVIPIYFIGGVQLISLGLIGEYIGRIYIEVKNRPRYIIDKYI